jgi:hypothetical protein
MIGDAAAGRGELDLVGVESHTDLTLQKTELNITISSPGRLHKFLRYNLMRGAPKPTTHPAFAPFRAVRFR